jgi:hypothetical protein
MVLHDVGMVPCRLVESMVLQASRAGAAVWQKGACNKHACKALAPLSCLAVTSLLATAAPSMHCDNRNAATCISSSAAIVLHTFGSEPCRPRPLSCLRPAVQHSEVRVAISNLAAGRVMQDPVSRSLLLHQVASNSPHCQRHYSQRLQARHRAPSCWQRPADGLVGQQHRGTGIPTTSHGAPLSNTSRSPQNPARQAQGIHTFGWSMPTAPDDSAAGAGGQGCSGLLTATTSWSWWTRTRAACRSGR